MIMKIILQIEKQVLKDSKMITKVEYKGNKFRKEVEW